MNRKAMSEQDVRDVIGNFQIEGTFMSFRPINDGHINCTYAVSFTQTGGDVKRYVLQAVNTSIFRNPVELIENIRSVTEFLRKKIAAQGGDPERETLQLVPAADGKYYFENEAGFWRVYRYIEGAIAYQSAEKPVLFRNSAVAFGRFQKLLADYPAQTLHETIPQFHDTPKRYRNFHAALATDKAGRKKDVEKEIAFYLEHEKIADTITSKIAAGEIPLRVTHNDTKLNNIMMDAVTDEAVCVIDLDTVMPGSALYDFGDSIRFGASSGKEDEKDIDSIFMREDLFEAYTEGYLSQARDSLTEREISLLPMGAVLMTLECGLRFLTDYLDGDTYFAVHYPGQNLDRTRTQAKLAWDMEQKYARMEQIVARYAAK